MSGCLRLFWDTCIRTCVMAARRIGLRSTSNASHRADHGQPCRWLSVCPGTTFSVADIFFHSGCRLCDLCLNASGLIQVKSCSLRGSLVRCPQCGTKALTHTYTCMYGHGIFPCRNCTHQLCTPARRLHSNIMYTTVWRKTHHRVTKS